MSAPAFPRRATARTAPRRAARAWHPGPAWLPAVDAAAILVLAGIALVGMHLAYGGDPRYLVAGGVGALVGLAVGLGSSAARFGVLATAGAAVVLYIVAGSAAATPDEAAAGFLPSLGSLRTLVLGVVVAWKDNLTVAAPLGTGSGLLVVPYLATFVASLAAGLAACRARPPYWPLVPLVGLFIAGIAFGTSDSFAALPRGIGFALVGILWAAGRRAAISASAGPEASGETTVLNRAARRRGRLGRAGLGAAVAAVAIVLTLVLAPALTAVAQRDVLRDRVVPPFDPRSYASPLSAFRALVKDQRDATLMTVTGLPNGSRIRLAALDSYDGTVATIDQQGSGSFARVGTSGISGGPEGDALKGTPYTLGVTIGDYAGYFVPGARHDTAITFADPSSAAADGLYFNRLTDTAITTAGLGKGTRYSVQVEEPARPTDAQLGQAQYAQVGLPAVDGVPQALQAKAGDIVADAQSPYDRVKTLTLYFQKFGAFSNGLIAEGQVPSLSGHGAGRLSAMLAAKQMVGDDEQYAVMMSLMARSLGVPARVVMGFYPGSTPGTSPLDLKGKDVHAWVEVAFEGYGWVAFDPTPPKDNVPIPPDPQAISKPRPQVLQPPPPAQAPVELPPDSRPDVQDQDQHKNDFWRIVGPILATIGIGLIPIAVVVLPLFGIVWLKLRRRRIRFEAEHAADRIGGGWSEIASLATDMGAPINPRGTRREAAVQLADAFGEAAGTTTALARRADAAVFGAGQPSDEDVELYWKDVETSMTAMTSGLGFWARQRVRFSLRSLIVDGRALFVAIGRSMKFRRGGV
ncbi:transglutaminase-like domain-containing protein [Sinomonas sp. JGH33]|uniref:Transglutaminase-like domain-containing protein n=1 Tax=Sinomonas terricola TaxID=3110330 RepID=A0ABU5T4W5_9MICC|nr:transglutaminase-like domain-containing protein [Sinomonas sp. JGH33]MEA5454698.1 transglutaminase-like domain-containing protein [Sinomonas sp. JGH33]